MELSQRDVNYGFKLVWREKDDVSAVTETTQQWPDN